MVFLRVQSAMPSQSNRLQARPANSSQVTYENRSWLINVGDLTSAWCQVVQSVLRRSTEPDVAIAIESVFCRERAR